MKTVSKRLLTAITVATALTAASSVFALSYNGNSVLNSSNSDVKLVVDGGCDVATFPASLANNTSAPVTLTGKGGFCTGLSYVDSSTNQTLCRFTFDSSGFGNQTSGNCSVLNGAQLIIFSK